MPVDAAGAPGAHGAEGGPLGRMGSGADVPRSVDPAVVVPEHPPTPAPHAPSPAPTGSPGQHPPRPPADRRPTGSESGRRGRSSGQDGAERSLRSLVTTRSTQVSSTAAMRAREVALPDAADLAAAEADLVIVRRHYVPPTSLSTGRRPDRRPGQGRAGNGTGAD